MFGYKKSVLPTYLLVFVFVWLSTVSCSFRFQPFKLIRHEKDIFENPTVTSCDHLGVGYCTSRNARCAWGEYGRNGCCYCLCDYRVSTFDISILKCQASSHFRKGCNSKFVNVYSGSPIKVLDLSRKSSAEVILQLQYVGKSNSDKLKSCSLNGVHVFLRDGRLFKVNENLFTLGNVNKNGHVDIKWNKVHQIKYHGQIFKVSVICDIEKKRRRRKAIKLRTTDCFVFKSSGTFTVYPLPSPSSATPFSQSMRKTSTPSFPPASSSRVVQKLSPTSTFLPVEPSSFEPVEPSSVEATPVVSSPNIVMTTMAGFETKTFPSVAISSVHLTPVTTPTSTKGVEEHGKMTTKEPSAIMPSSTSYYIAEMSSKHHVDPKARNESGGDKIAVISSAVVVCVLIILAICLFLLWSRKRKGKTPAQKQNHAGLCNGGTTVDDNNAMAMNPFSENIYAEADVAVNSNCVGEKGNRVYEYADNTIDNNYTSLDKTIREENNQYQPLHTDHAYERISQSKVRASGQPSVNAGPGNKYDERVYSVLEDENNPQHATSPVSEAIYHELDDFTPPETSGRVPDDTNKHDERVYSVLEDDDSKTTMDTTSPVSEPIYYEPDHTAGVISGRVPHLSPGSENNERVYSVLEETGNESMVTTPESDYVTILPETSDYEKPVGVSNA